jgi:hypothetical protein
MISSGHDNQTMNEDSPPRDKPRCCPHRRLLLGNLCSYTTGATRGGAGSPRPPRRPRTPSTSRQDSSPTRWRSTRGSAPTSQPPQEGLPPPPPPPPYRSSTSSCWRRGVRMGRRCRRRTSGWPWRPSPAPGASGDITSRSSIRRSRCWRRGGARGGGTRSLPARGQVQVQVQERAPSTLSSAGRSDGR